MGRRWIAAAALALLGAFAAPAQAALTADSMLAPETVVAIDLQLAPAALEALEAAPGKYVEGTFSLAESTDGTPAGLGAFSPPIAVGIRLKGSASFESLAGKAAFKVKFNEFVKGQKFLGLKKMTLNSMVQDPSMTHEVLAYEAFRAAGIVAPHAGYAYVRLNGVDYGLHLNLETLDDVALEKRFGDFLDPPQHLYEGGGNVDVTPGGAGAFEVDEGDEEDRGDLEALIAAVAEPAPDFSTRMAAVADLGQMTTMWAAERYLAHWDGYTGTPTNNYYLYSEPSGRFQMLPWGTDQTVEHWWMPFAGSGGELFDQCQADPVCRQDYRDAMVAVKASSEALDLPAQALAIAQLLAPWQAREIAESERELYDAEEIEAAVDDVLYFFERRTDLLEAWLADGTEPGEDPDPGEEPDPEPQSGPQEHHQIHPQPVSAGDPAPPAALSGRFEVDRSRLSRGVLLTRIAIPGPGTVWQLGQIVGADGALRACAGKLQVTAAGRPTLRCRLTPEARDRLAKRPLTLRLETRLEAGGGIVAAVRRDVVLPRQAR